MNTNIFAFKHLSICEFQCRTSHSKENNKDAQIYLDPSGGDDGEAEEGLDREDEESGFEVKKKRCLLQK